MPQGAHARQSTRLLASAQRNSGSRTRSVLVRSWRKASPCEGGPCCCDESDELPASRLAAHLPPRAREARRRRALSGASGAGAAGGRTRALFAARSRSRSKPQRRRVGESVRFGSLKIWFGWFARVARAQARAGALRKRAPTSELTTESASSLLARIFRAGAGHAAHARAQARVTRHALSGMAAAAAAKRRASSGRMPAAARSPGSSSL